LVRCHEDEENGEYEDRPNPNQPVPTLNSLTATATLGEEVHVNVTGTYEAPFEQEMGVWTYTAPIHIQFS
jgi:hypothetical protein